MKQLFRNYLIRTEENTLFWNIAVEAIINGHPAIKAGGRKLLFHPNQRIEILPPTT